MNARTFLTIALISLLAADAALAQRTRGSRRRVTAASTARPATASRPLALIYNGPGSCEDENLETEDEELKPAINDCSVQAAVVAKKAGYRPQFVGPEAVGEDSVAKIDALFETARVWIQPGGNSGPVFDSMSEEFERGLTRFIRAGGGYVGFCAGAFMATEYIGKHGEPALGLFPGTSIAFPHGVERPDLSYELIPVTWNGVTRRVFIEGGPYLIIPEDAKAEVVATYESGAVAAARTQFGKGRVFITGLHPEAPKRWTQEDGITDPDGTEQGLAAEMVRWAASKTSVKMPSPKPPRNPQSDRD